LRALLDDDAMTKRSKTDVWMPFYFGDYHKDTGHLLTIEHGAYILLIGHYWTTKSPLPNDDESLRSITRLDKPAWRKHKAKVLSFFRSDGSVLRHSRIDTEISYADEMLERNRDRTAKATAARLARNEERNEERNGSRYVVPHAGEGEGPSGNRNSTVSKIGTTSSDGDEWGAK
jgi:uncharacterized protein YdaU (DUF1376 family)